MVAALIACGPDYPPLPLGVARESACVGDGNTAHGGSLDVAVDAVRHAWPSFLAEIHAGAAAAVNADAATVATTEELVC